MGNKFVEKNKAIKATHVRLSALKSALVSFVLCFSFILWCQLCNMYTAPRYPFSKHNRHFGHVHLEFGISRNFFIYFFNI